MVSRKKLRGDRKKVRKNQNSPQRPSEATIILKKHLPLIPLQHTGKSHPPFSIELSNLHQDPPRPPAGAVPVAVTAGWSMLPPGTAAADYVIEKVCTWVLLSLLGPHSIAQRLQLKDRGKNYLILGEIYFSRELTITVLSRLGRIRP